MVNDVLARQVSRRRAVQGLAACATAPWLGHRSAAASEETPLRLATFTADVTPPLGHPLMGGGIAPAREIVDPLLVHGLVLQVGGGPIVLASVDWCEIRNDAYERWRAALAEAVGTVSERVLVTCVHVHDAPIADLEAQRLLERNRAAGAICFFDFHEQAVQSAARAAKASLAKARRVTHIGTGQAKVEQVASNRRYLLSDGTPAFNRMSATRDPEIRAQPEGTIDPRLKTISFWDGDRPLAALSCYATHPMSYYGQGGVSADFVGMARRRRQQDEPAVFQIYASGCSGNVTAGKYNDGDRANRAVLAERIYRALRAAWDATARQPVSRPGFRRVPLTLPLRDGPGFTADDLQKRLREDGRPFGQCLAALGLSWRKRVEAGRRIDVPSIDFGPAQLLLLPAEAYVEFQLLAERTRPDSFVIAMGYGECGPGYIPIERAFAENDGNLHDWCWVGPGSEAAMTEAIRAALDWK